MLRFRRYGTIGVAMVRNPFVDVGDKTDICYHVP